LDYTFPPSFPPTAQDFISRLLVIEPHKRLGGSKPRYDQNDRSKIVEGGIKEIKDHEFFTAGWNELGIEGWEDIWKCEVPPMETGMTPPRVVVQPNFDEFEFDNFRGGNDDDDEEEIPYAEGYGPGSGRGRDGVSIEEDALEAVPTPTVESELTSSKTLEEGVEVEVLAETGEGWKDGRGNEGEKPDQKL
jgi:hypothetical protein